MKLKSKTLTGVVQPLAYVDEILRQQGFRRAGGDLPPRAGVDLPPTYDVLIYDSATSISYFLRIPTSFPHKYTDSSEPTVKLGQPYLEAKTSVTAGEDEYILIPQAIRQAAEHKVAEVADYLSSASPE